MTYASLILKAAKAAHVSAVLLMAICSHESRSFTLDFTEYDGDSPSFGVCQVKFFTAQQLGYQGKPEDLRNAEVSTKYSALYLKYQQDRYGDDWVKITAAYNSGTYTEGKKVGCPRNLKYIRLVRQKLPEELRYRLDCGEK